MYPRYAIRDPFYLVSILSFSLPRKMHSSDVCHFGSALFSVCVCLPHSYLFLPLKAFKRLPSLSLLVFFKFPALRYFVYGRSFAPRKYDTLDSLPLPTLIRPAAREWRTTRSSKLANGYGRCSFERESPVKQYSVKFW